MSDLVKPMPCIVCSVQLEPIGNVAVHQPNDATIFRASGNYGSGVWDPMSGGVCLTINVCDECLVARHDRVAEIHTVRREPEVKFVPWERPGDDDD